VLAIDIEGQKDVIGIYVGENESSKFWLSVLNDLKNRGVKDILILIKDAINAAFPNTEYQRCIVHQIRNTLKYVSDKDRKEFARDFSEKWEKKMLFVHFFNTIESLNSSYRRINKSRTVFPGENGRCVSKGVYSIIKGFRETLVS